MHQHNTRQYNRGLSRLLLCALALLALACAGWGVPTGSVVYVDVPGHGPRVKPKTIDVLFTAQDYQFDDEHHANATVWLRKKGTLQPVAHKYVDRVHDANLVTFNKVKPDHYLIHVELNYSILTDFPLPVHYTIETLDIWSEDPFPMRGKSFYNINGASPTHGDPVNLATGEETHTAFTDIEAFNPVTGGSVGFQRTFSTSVSTINRGSLGLSTGWTHQYDYCLLLTEATPSVTDPVILYAPNGGTDYFYPEIVEGKPTGRFTAGSDAPYVVTGTHDGATGWRSIDLHFKNGERWTFARMNPHVYTLRTITDELGRSVTLLWDDTRRLRQVGAQDMKAGLTASLLYFAYDSHGKLDYIEDQQGHRRVYFTFSTLPTTPEVLLTKVSQLVPSYTLRVGALDYWTYQYTLRPAPHEMTGVFYYGSAYTPAIRYLHSLYFDAYPSLHGTMISYPLLTAISQPSPTGSGLSTLTFSYDGEDRVIRQTDANGNYHEYNYDTELATVVTAKDASGATVRTWTVHYDDEDRFTGATDALGRSTGVEYGDIRHPYQPTRVIDTDGKSIAFAYDDIGHLTSVTDQRGVLTTFQYDTANDFGRLTHVQCGGLTPTTYTYVNATSPFVKTVTMPKPGEIGATVTSTYTYDFEVDRTQNFGRLVRVDYPGNNAVAANYETLTYNYTHDAQYNAAGLPGAYTATPPTSQPLTVTDKRGRTVHYRYDTSGHVVCAIDPDGQRVNITYNNLGLPTDVYLPADTDGARRRLQTTYHLPSGLPLSSNMRNGAGAVVSTSGQTYDHEGHVLSVAANGLSTHYGYNAVYELSTLTDPGGKVTQYSHDSIGRLVQVTYPDSTSYRIAACDTADRPLDVVDGKGAHTYFTYNATTGDLATIAHGSTTPDTTFSYDGLGRLQQVQDTAGTRSWTYDELGDILTAVTQYTGLPSKTLTYQYYPDGSRKQLATPFGNFTYLYNTDGQLTSLTNPSNRTSRWAYRPDGTLAEQTLGNRVWTDYRKDAFDRLAGLLNRNPKGRLLSETGELNRDVFESLTGQRLTTPGQPAHSGSSSLQYDVYGRLTAEQWTPLHGQAMNHAFTYDNNGNILTFPRELPGHVGQTRTYDDANKWIGYNGTALPQLLNYDGNGNPTTWKGSALTYDALDHLTSYATNGASQLTAGYRADDLRAWKESNGHRTYYLYDGLALLAELDAAGTVTTYQTWGTTGLLNRTTLQTNAERWYLFDAQGNVAQRTDATGAVLSTDRYDAWGHREDGGDPTDPVGYGGQYGYYTDPETGLLLCTWRYYDPEVGRWLTQDPIGYAGGLNLYRYCADDPINLCDPSGLLTFYGFDGNPFLEFDGGWKEVGAGALDSAYHTVTGTVDSLARISGDPGRVYSYIVDQTAAGYLIQRVIYWNPSSAIWCEIDYDSGCYAAGDAAFQVALVVVPMAGEAALAKNASRISKLENAVIKVTNNVEKEALTSADYTGTIRNAKLAGKAHPNTGVMFDEHGYPIFDAKAEVKIQFSGNRATDFKLANEAAGFKRTPNGYVWHHHQDCQTMQLVEKSIHAATGHTGGFAIWSWISAVL